MPQYDFKCKKCETYELDVHLRITHTERALPMHCNEPMGYFITSPPMVVWNDPVIEPFRSMATRDKPIISSMKEKREYMARNDLVDANELGPPPSLSDTAKAQAEVQQSIDAMKPTGQLKEEMKRQNLLDVIPD
jgi:hypothetical protein